LILKVCLISLKVAYLSLKTIHRVIEASDLVLQTVLVIVKGLLFGSAGRCKTRRLKQQAEQSQEKTPTSRFYVYSAR